MHDTPTILKYLEELTGISQDNVDFTDRNVFGIFQGYENLGIDPKWFPINKATAGIPEFNTPFLKQMLDEVEPKTFSELNRICGASHGTDVWMGNIRDVVLSGTATLSEVPCTRDDIMNYLISKGVDNKIAFNIMERVRKGKELTNELLKVLKDNNIPEWYVNILKKIKYLFPKSHATAYLITAFKIAWYKYYYPLEFYAVTFSVRPEEFKIEYAFEDPKVIKEEIFKLSSNYGLEKKEKDKLMILELILEMRLRGYTFKNVDINKSHYSRFLPVDNQLLIPLDKIDGLGDIAAKKIWEFRKTKNIEFEEELSKLVNKNVMKELKDKQVVNLKKIEDTKNRLF